MKDEEILMRKSKFSDAQIMGVLRQGNCQRAPLAMRNPRVKLPNGGVFAPK